MDINKVNEIKKITIIALASDDCLVQDLVLKGGNAIDLAFASDPGKVSRTSYDLDYSISGGDFKEDVDTIAKRIFETLEQTFREYGYILIDYKFEIKPKRPNETTFDFWGGYKATFKLIEEAEYEQIKTDPEKVRRNTIPVNPNHSPKFELEFSKYEYVEGSRELNYDGFQIRVYTPEMIVFEKVRALCQQLSEYGEIVPKFNPRARARDFYDIYLVMEQFNIDPTTPENLEMIANIFHAKKVPLSFIKLLRTNIEFHYENWIDVISTLDSSSSPEPFEFYVQYLLDKYENLKFPLE